MESVPQQRRELPLQPVSTPSASTSPQPTQSSQVPAEEVSFYEAIGGSPTFQRLVEVFYAGVETDPILRPLYPEADLKPAARRLRLFLEQYWGGPTTYSAERGHPRLRMRHAPYRIGPRERDAWLHHMRRAVDELQLPEEYEKTLWDYLERAAHFMVNSPE